MSTGKTIQLTVILLFLTSMAAEAASFDGTYNYAYQYLGTGGKTQSYSVPSGFIVRSGQISSSPAGELSGSIDASGNARFQGMCPQSGGAATATFTGRIMTDGTGSGSYTCYYGGKSLGYGGTWSVRRVSGGNGSSSDFIDADIAVAIAAAGIIAGLAMIISRSRSTSSSKPGDAKRIGSQRGMPPRYPPGAARMPQETSGATGSYHYAPAIGGGMHEIPPSPITLTAGRSIEGIGVHQGPPPPHPAVENLRATWLQGQVRLDWEAPQFDTSREQLEGYFVYRLEQVRWSTMPQKILISGQLPPGTTAWHGPHIQTYRWNTSGDIKGYVVEPVYRSIAGQTSGNVYFGNGATAGVILG